MNGADWLVTANPEQNHITLKCSCAWGLTSWPESAEDAIIDHLRTHGVNAIKVFPPDTMSNETRILGSVEE